ncbi:putative RING finger domain protein [Aspergillus lucknowensis]|uniref:RING-type domain-containing protein n=1 Tax=Aspergillus lucknowensis TaxID=176173 RepID=A0ABR4LKP3_9EURO
MNSDSVQFLAARRRKRPRRDLSATPQAQSSNSTTYPPLPPLALPTVRYPGDGLDFRRPATSSAQREEEVIDLTNEPDSPEVSREQQASGGESSSRRPRPPRFGRDIIADVVDLEEQEPDTPSSPEVQFLSSTVRQQLPPPPRPPPRTPGLMSSNFWRMLPLPHASFFGSANEPAYRREVPWRAASHLSRAELETLLIGDVDAMDFTINLDLDDWQLPGSTPEVTRPQSSYKPPSPAPEGFTRSVEEDDIATCPNCDEELGTGDDTKQQIWVAKQCGHVYCGECATNRSLTKAKKTSSRTKPFAKCPVPDCGKPISAPKSMFQVYL